MKMPIKCCVDHNLILMHLKELQRLGGEDTLVIFDSIQIFCVRGLSGEGGQGDGQIITKLFNV
jgi:hypothetical protein